MNLQELGGLLKLERERRGLSVRDVMEATKISRRNLMALEEGRVGQLPHPVYLKGYVRNYARLVGLEPDPLAAIVDQQSDGDAGYVEQRPTPAAAPAAEAPPVADPAPSGAAEPEAARQDDQTPAAQPSGESEPVRPLGDGASQPAAAMPRRRLWPWLVLLALIGLGVLAANQCQRIRADMDQAQPAANATQSTAAATAAAESAAAESPADVNATGAGPSGASVPEPGVPPDANASLAPFAPSLEPAAQAALPAAPGLAVVTASSIEVSRQQPSAPAPASAPAPEIRTPGMQELVVIAKPGEACWVELTEGQRRKTFTIRDGDSRRFEFSQTARVRLGNAGGVVFRLNGSAYPYDGQRGQTATLEIGGR